MTGWSIRPESTGDQVAIEAVIAAAFDDHPHSDGSEPAIVAALRADRDLAVSLVADDGAIVGHVAFSPVTIGEGGAGWFGLGPVSVLPERQRAGIGAALIEAGLARVRTMGAKGCVVLGDPGYYRRFGFAHDPALVFPDAPAEYFQWLAFDGATPAGLVRYAPAFG